MAPRWSWDFEDEHKARARPPQPVAPPPSSPPPAAAPRAAGELAQKIRRRRGAAAAVILLVAVLAVSALAGGSHHARTHNPSAGRAHLVPIPVEGQAQDEAAVRSVLAYTPFVRHGSTQGRDVALTFDDGPGPYTGQVLDVLERNHARATFFVIGRMLRYFGRSTERQIADGDAIGDHTENHPALAHLSQHDQREELFEQILRVEFLGGHRPQLFRPPYGSFNATTMAQLRSLDLLMVLWSADTGDYEKPGVPVIVQRALEAAKPGAIILLHDGGGNRAETVAALPAIIKGIRARGLRLVTVPQMLHDEPPPSGEPMPTSLAGD
jgi:peptidoglycan/xylan/chitin deacetylase (PgdA/CDA1 family)